MFSPDGKRSSERKAFSCIDGIFFAKVWFADEEAELLLRSFQIIATKANKNYTLGIFP